MASASSSSSKPKRNYDVFLSFRGTDVRNNFLSHLYTALDQNGLFTYLDSEELRKGEQISPALMKAIEESQVAIIVFSKDYASSPWCLEEVAKIMECKIQKDLIVLPVFYKVEPREVRGGRESYGRAMVKHESKFGKESEKVRRWKEALFDAGSLSGWHLNDGDEAKLIQSIVKEISRQLDRTPLHVAKYPVGINPRVEKMVSMLNLESDDVLMIGLWGPGGMGKTTYAKALYNAIFRKFEGSCFLANVREASKDSKDLVPLQEKLLSKILWGKTFTVFNVDGGINLIQYRLCHKKVLLVLDDVNDIKQLNALAGDCEWFGKGSRIIITTRDNHLLTSHGIDKDQIYEVKILEHCEAFKLFNKHAFLRSNKIAIRRDLVDSALEYANRLPLALEVLGSFLCGRREHEWRSALNKLAKSPDKTINDVLKLSYDALEDYQKEIFLDIACFFKGRYTKDIRKVLDSCDFDTTIGVQVLVEKSLITEEYGKLQMHDLIQLMGMDIVRQECRDDPGKRSRLWLCDDVYYVMSRDLGTSAVKAIVLDLPKPKEIYIDPDAFTNMRKLRVLIMINAHTSFQGPICLPNELRWLEWPECPSWNQELCAGPKNLVGLDLRKSNIQVAREQFKDFKNLKFLNFSECQSLVCMPDLNYTPNLEELNLHGCKNLERGHESVAYHGKLQLLNLSGCSELHHLCDVLQANNLQSINLRDCSKLQRFPDIPCENKSLLNLHLDGTPIKELFASIENLVSLEDMTLSNCKNLAILPSSIYKLQNLERLILDGCSKLINFPKKDESSDPHMKIGFPKLLELNLRNCSLLEVDFLKKHSCFSFLRDLNLSGNNFTKFSISEQLHYLHNLDISYCQQLQEVLEIPRHVQCLTAVSCESLRKISTDKCPARSNILSSCYELARHGFIVNDFHKPEVQKYNHVLLPGEEMPKWLLPNKEGCITFLASKDLYEKIGGLALAIVLQVKGNKNAKLKIQAYVNGERMTKESERERAMPLDLNHVAFVVKEMKYLWKDVSFGPNGYWNHFQCSITASGGIIVKKFGFRLLCKSLENELEVLLQDDQLHDPALFYEVLDENQTSTEEDSPREFVHKGLDEIQTSTEEDSLGKFVHKGLNMTDFSIEKYRYSQISPAYRNVLLGGEMPEQFVLVEDGTISFMASQDLYDKFLGLALCVAFNVEDREKEISFELVPNVNGERRNVLSGILGSFDSDHMWIQYLKSNVLWGLLEGGVDFDQFEESYLQFSLRIRVSGGTVKKLGYVLRCGQLEDDLKVVLEDNQFVDSTALCEDFDGSIGLREFLRKCHLPVEKLGNSESESESEDD